MRITSENKQATRCRILNAAKKLFNQQGYDATTTRDIARAAEIAAGTLFNYFPTKEAIVASLLDEALTALAVEQQPAGTTIGGGIAAEDSPSAATLEEDLFGQVAAVLRTLKPYRKYLPAVLELTLSPVRSAAAPDLLRTAHLEGVGRVLSRHGFHDALTAVALQLYWTLYAGVLTFWSHDRSPRQEDTLALLDQSIAMFVGWLATSPSSESAKKEG